MRCLKVSDSEFERSESVSCEDIKVEMATLHELAAPNLETQPLSITYPVLDQPLKLNSGFLNYCLSFMDYLVSTYIAILMSLLLHVQPCNLRS